MGHTAIGIHRADVSLKADDRSIARRLSRGQGKFIVGCTMMALNRFMFNETAKPPIMLIDDLAAELDDKMRQALVDIISQAPGQHVYTAIKPDDLPTVADSTSMMFHVEQANRPDTA